MDRGVISRLSSTELIGSGLRVLALLYFVLPTNVDTVWWAYNGQLNMDAATMCKRLTKAGPQQTSMCSNSLEIVRQVALGVDLAVVECKLQFEERHWNCDTTVKRSVEKLFKTDTREAAYVQAIVAAGALHAVAEACSRGQLLACSCDTSGFGRGQNSRPSLPPRSPQATVGGGVGAGAVTVPRAPSDESSTTTATTAATGGEFMWAGCNDDVKFAYDETKKFLHVEQNSNSGTDFRAMIQQHNLEAGRLASKLHMRTKCKCHGLSGSCVTKTCWQRVDEFIRVGDRLRDAYDSARQVTVSNDYGNKLVLSSTSVLQSTPRNSRSRGDRPRTQMPLASSHPESLVFSDASPDYCKRQRSLGLLGTRGRRCNATSTGIGSCEVLCCNRGSRARHVTVQQNCNCKFRWCCEVVCETCFVDETIHTCK